MKLQILNIHEACVTISSSAAAILELYDELCGFGGNPHFEYVVKALAERIREANRVIETELDPLMNQMNVEHPAIEIQIVDTVKPDVLM